MGNAHRYNAAATRLAAKAAFAFPDVCTIESPNETFSRGQVAQNFSTLHEAVPCLGRPLGGSERMVNESLSAVETEEWLMPAQMGGVEIAIKANHRFTVAARGAQGARTYQVTSVGNAAGVYLKIFATRQG